MKSKRVYRISSEIQKEISRLLLNGLKDPHIDNVTTSITEVEVTNDLSFAYVYISVLGDQKAKDMTIKGFEKAKGFIKRELGKTLELRHIPELIFKIDSSIERGMYMNQLIEKIKQEDEAKEVKEESSDEK